MTTAVPSLLCLAALAACSRSIERFDHTSGFLPEKPATQFPRVGDVGASLVYGVRLVDPKNQYRLITEFVLGWDGLGTQIRGGTTD